MIPELDGLFRINCMHYSIAGASPFVEFYGYEAMGQPWCIDRSIQCRQYVWQRSDVVLVPVGDKDAAHPVCLGGQIRDIRYDQVNPGHVLRWELHPAVDDDDVIPAFQHHHVLADLTQPAQRQDPQRFVRERARHRQRDHAGPDQNSRC